MDEGATLVYVSSDAIQRFCSAHPINWGSRELANGPGNLLTPSPALAEFFSCLNAQGALFCQKDYARWCWRQWKDWKSELSIEQKKGISHRLFRNFYPSAIDSLHVWAMLVETGRFDRCVVSTKDDVVGKTDISVWAIDADTPIQVALHVDNEYTRRWTAYKRSARGDVPTGLVDVMLTLDRPRRPGNKRWYTVEDLTLVLQAASTKEAA